MSLCHVTITASNLLHNYETKTEMTVHVDQLFAAFTDFSGSVAKAVAEGKYREIDKARLVFRTFCVKHDLSVDFEIQGDKEQTRSEYERETAYEQTITRTENEYEELNELMTAYGDMVHTVPPLPVNIERYRRAVRSFVKAVTDNGRLHLNDGGKLDTRGSPI